MKMSVILKSHFGLELFQVIYGINYYEIELMLGYQIKGLERSENAGKRDFGHSSIIDFQYCWRLQFANILHFGNKEFYQVKMFYLLLQTHIQIYHRYMRYNFSIVEK